ncbi:GDSL-type esterase/lipase family protein [Peribacillus sp. SCS-37]|uniref:GDSL-type esterase/lipase family protein n=1 Tax=Paraperibacillus esterisolvens TaxID=3115296 RepID=UPI00390627B4
MKKFNWIFLPMLLAIALIGAYIMNQPDEEKDEKVITALGDSLTYGLGDAKGNGYTDALEEQLNRDHAEAVYRTKSYGIVGLESGGLIKRLAEPKLARSVAHSDYVIIFIGTNDLVNSTKEHHLMHLSPDRAGAAKKEYLENLDHMIDGVKTLNQDVPIILIGLYNPYPESGRKIEHYIDDWNKSVYSLAKHKRNVAYIPTNNLFKDKEKDEYFFDELHVNDKGYDLIADRIANNYHF